MSLTVKLSLAAACLLSGLAAQAQTNSVDGAHHSSCSARYIERFYCPAAGDQWWGPYFDNGCSVKCADGQTATCTEATCNDNRDGDSVASSCVCD
jgi:hypothetical protein